MHNYYSEERPWGKFTNYYEGENYKIKEIVVKPGQRLSYQVHEKRAEHWFVVQGQGMATINDVEKPVVIGDTLDIPTQTKHRIGNTGSEDLIFIEVQTGSYFGEDDIVRLSDDYSRAE